MRELTHISISEVWLRENQSHQTELECASSMFEPCPEVPAVLGYPCLSTEHWELMEELWSCCHCTVRPNLCENQGMGSAWWGSKNNIFLPLCTAGRAQFGVCWLPNVCPVCYPMQGHVCCSPKHRLVAKQQLSSWWKAL